MGESSDASSREPVIFDPATRQLTVGRHSATVPDVPDLNEAMLRGYLAVVAKARGTAVASLTQVRQHDVDVLAELLDLSDDDLEARFVRLLGMTPAVAADTRQRLARHRALLAAAGISVGMLISSSGAAASSGGPAAAAAPAAISVAASANGTIEATTRMAMLAETTTTEPAEPPAPPSTVPSGAVQIGDALVIERGTQPDDPNVQIGDAETYER